MTATDSIRAEFLRDICANPDDTPRLIFADWLEEYGGDDARAEFIRIGCEYREHGQRPSIHWIDWPATIDAKWHRGFVERVYLTLNDFLQHAAVLLASHPITEVRLTDKEPYVSESGVATWYDVNRERAGGDHRQSDLPTSLFLALSGEVRFDANGGVKYYSSSDLAVTAISSACVTYGRSLANLPPLAR